MKLKEYRRANRLRQTHFANLLGVTPSTISRYESGRVPDLRTIRAIKTATGGAVAEDDWSTDRGAQA